MRSLTITRGKAGLDDDQGHGEAETSGVDWSPGRGAG